VLLASTDRKYPMSSKSSPTVDAHEHGIHVSPPENENENENENEPHTVEAGRKTFTLLSFWEEKERSSRELVEGKTRPTPTTAKIATKSSHSQPQPKVDSITEAKSSSDDGPRKVVKEIDSVKVVVFPPSPPSNAVFKEKSTELEKVSKSKGNGSSEGAVFGDESNSKHVSFMLGCDRGILGGDSDGSTHDGLIVESEIDNAQLNANNNQECVLNSPTTTKDSHDTLSFSNSMSESDQDSKSTNSEHSEDEEVRAVDRCIKSPGSIIETGIASLLENADDENTNGLEQSDSCRGNHVDNDVIETHQNIVAYDIENGFEKNEGSDDGTQLFHDLTVREPWWKKNRNAIFFSAFVLVIISVAVIGLVFSPKPSDSNRTGSLDFSDENTLDITSEPSEVDKDSGDVVFVETLSPSSFSSYTLPPTTAKVVIPSSMPSMSPTGCAQQASGEAEQLSFDPSGNSSYTKIASDGNDMIATTESGEVVFYSLTNDGIWKNVLEINIGHYHNYSSVAISNGIAVIGHPYASETGRIHVYERNETSNSWNEIEDILFANEEGEIGGGFGWSVGVSSSSDGGLIVVGAPFENYTTGSVYVFERNGLGVWSELGNFLPSLCAEERYGKSVAVYGNLIAMSADCEVNVQIFEYDKSSKSFNKHQNLYYVQFNSGIISSMAMNSNNLVYSTVLGVITIFETTQNKQFTFQQELFVGRDEISDYPVALSKNLLATGIGNQTVMFSLDAGDLRSGLFWKQIGSLERVTSNTTNSVSVSIALVHYNTLLGYSNEIISYHFEDCAVPMPTQHPSMSLVPTQPSVTPSNLQNHSSSIHPSVAPSVPDSSPVSGIPTTLVPRPGTGSAQPFQPSLFDETVEPTFDNIPSTNPSPSSSEQQMNTQSALPTLSQMPSTSPISQLNETSASPVGTQPSLSPSNQRLAAPSMNPTNGESQSPAVAPSANPTKSESQSPSIMPTISHLPSLFPSSFSSSPSSSLAPTSSSRPSHQPTVTVMPTSPCYVIDITVYFDNKPLETGWVLTKADSSGSISTVETYFPMESSLANERQDNAVCVKEGNYTFAMYDSGGDGICCDHGSGAYVVVAQGAIVADGGEFGYSEAVTFYIPFSL